MAIDLHPLHAPALALLRTSPEVYAKREQVDFGDATELVRGIAESTAAYFGDRIDALGPDGTWGGYLTVDRATRRVVGTCAFKGPPDGDGAVEIAYYTFPEFERQGYATAMAETLRALALAVPSIAIVRAHTLRERNASARLLDKLGFAGPVEVVDPDDGPVWRWEWRR
jgi:RimJ/RimL family protein N-acetyltransferase